MINDAYIVAGCRTPVGRYGGALSSVRPDDLMALTIKETVQRARIDPEVIDEVIVGNANGAGEENRNVARMAWLLAGFPDTVPGLTINRLCASGMSSIAFASALIQSGQADVVLAGGVESMSRAPWVLEKPRRAFAKPGEIVDSAIGWRFINPEFLKKEKFTYAMPETAEEVAKVFGINRERADEFALRSHRLACAAIDEGKFEAEIVPVEVSGRKGEVTTVATDEGPRPDTSAEVLSQLRPVTSLGSVTTAGNSSSLNDGASCVLLMSEKAAKEYGVDPRARVVANSARGVKPEIMGTGPIPATRDVLERASWTLDSVDAVELNEAFATQSLACIDELGLDIDKVNTWGGAIALGHPLGSSGSRITLTLLHRLEAENLSRGVATMCVGVGQGTAIAIERV